MIRKTIRIIKRAPGKGIDQDAKHDPRQVTETQTHAEIVRKRKEKLIANLKNEYWRLNNLYYVINENGEAVRFRMRPEQYNLYRSMWYLNVILKARQLGFTTFIQILILDRCMFNSNVRAGVIAHTRDDAQIFFRDKIKFAYNHLPSFIRRRVPALKNDAGELLLANNSSIRVGTSLRSGTLQYLHISEFGKICAKYPEKAREIKTGSLNTVHPGQFVFIESTAEGKVGEFHAITERARKQHEEKRKLTSMDYKFHFFPWWKNPGYRLDIEHALITQEYLNYFEMLEKKNGIVLDPEQKAWYARKAEEQGDDMKREYPSTPDEAFEQSVIGAYFWRQMAKIRERQQICQVPYDPRFKVYTFWDLGRRDMMSIWFMQYINGVARFIDYYENNGESIQFYCKLLKTDYDYIYGTLYMPHDVEVTDLSQGQNKTRKELVEEFGFDVETVPRVPDDMEGIEAVRGVLPMCYFDEVHCAKGILCLDNYRKEWDDKLETYKSTPLHNWASHGAKAFEQFARGFPLQMNSPGSQNRRRSSNWRTA